MRVAAIDCGTNTIRLLVADVEPGERAVRDVVRTGTVTRLGQGVDRTGELAPDALARTIDAAREFAGLVTEHGAERVRFVATSATRDARNREDFVAGVRDALGVTPEVVTGQEEAALSFAGVASGVATGHPGPYLVVDLGGGSTELVLGESAPEAAISLDVGSVRLHERHLHSDPPTQAEIEAATADARSAIDRAAAAVPLGRTATLVGVAGTITTVTARALDLPAYDRDRIDGAALATADVLAACDALLHTTQAERAAMPFLHPGRIDVIGAGALLWREIVTRVAAEVAGEGRSLDLVVTSERDILDGIALGLAARH